MPEKSHAQEVALCYHIMLVALILPTINEELPWTD